jgi:Arc/MetJ-type ribon-helix-helix transcriptional regulator
MKVSVSLPDEDVEFLDSYAREQGVASRSAVIREALRLLRANELGSDYAEAWQEWSAGPDREAWETVLADGLPAATP